MTADTTDLRGVQASVDTWIALRVTVVAAKASEALLGERMRNHRQNWRGKRASEQEGLEASKEGTWYAVASHSASRLAPAYSFVCICHLVSVKSRWNAVPSIGIKYALGWPRVQ